LFLFKNTKQCILVIAILKEEEMEVAKQEKIDTGALAEEIEEERDINTSMHHAPPSCMMRRHETCIMITMRWW
jgi:hypothetical protein